MSSPSSSSPAGFPSLQPAYYCRLNVKAEEMCPIGEIYIGSKSVYVPTVTGYIRSVEGFEPKVDAQVVGGGDFLYFDPSQEQARLNVKGVAKSAGGSIFTFGYTGCIHINEEISKIFSGVPMSIPFGQSTTNHYFETGDPQYKALENATWSGNGRFVFENGGLSVESRISQVVPSTENPPL
ncbi:MAG: hypothetical protein Q9166_004888 [cf. Caloplaca sp. 2 TL-2023]